MQSYQIPRHHSGMTLMELLIVVAILAAVSGSALVAFPNLEESQRQSVRESELRILASAISQYYQDTDLRFDHADHLMGLVQKPDDESMLWSLHRRRGWRGPYVDWRGRDADLLSHFILEEGDDGAFLQIRLAQSDEYIPTRMPPAP